MSFFEGGKTARTVYISATTIGLGLSLWGYSAVHLPGASAAELPLAIGGVILSALNLFIPRPEIMLDPCQSMAVRIAAFLCGVSGFIAAALVWITVAGRSAADIWTQLFRRGHVLVVGDGDFATRFATSLVQAKRSVVQAVDASASPLAAAAHRLRLTLTPEKLRSRAALHRSDKVVIDTGSDTGNMAQAMAIVGAAQEGDRKTSIALRVTDSVLSDRFLDHLQGKYAKLPMHVSVFDENRILARHVLASQPLFQRARERGQNRVHALIIGFGDLGEKLMDQVLLTSLAYDLGTPRVTIVDRDADARVSEFCARRPRVLSNLKIDFIPFDFDGLPCTGEPLSKAAKAIRIAESEDPFTMIYVALPQYNDVARTVLQLSRLREQFDMFKAPISYRCKLAGEEADVLNADTPPHVGADHGFLRMSLPTERLMDALLGQEEADALAICIHEAYRAGKDVSKEANKPWDELPDTFKRANRRAGDHIPAKLATVGVRAAWNEPLTEADRNNLQQILDLSNDDPLIQRLAELEHERWCIDRFLDGWAPGEADDHKRRIRRTLVPFAKLKSDKVQISKDIDQVRKAIRFLMDT